MLIEDRNAMYSHERQLNLIKKDEKMKRKERKVRSTIEQDRHALSHKIILILGHSTENGIFNSVLIFDVRLFRKTVNYVKKLENSVLYLI